MACPRYLLFVIVFFVYRLYFVLHFYCTQDSTDITVPSFTYGSDIQSAKRCLDYNRFPFPLLELVKRDPSLFPTLKDFKNWDAYHRSLTIQLALMRVVVASMGVTRMV